MGRGHLPVTEGFCKQQGYMNNLLVAEGRVSEKQYTEFSNGPKSHHLELLCCDGCTMGAECRLWKVYFDNIIGSVHVKRKL